MFFPDSCLFDSSTVMEKLVDNDYITYMEDNNNCSTTYGRLLQPWLNYNIGTAINITTNYSNDDMNNNFLIIKSYTNSWLTEDQIDELLCIYGEKFEDFKLDQNIPDGIIQTTQYQFGFQSVQINTDEILIDNVESTLTNVESTFVNNINSTFNMNYGNTSQELSDATYAALLQAEFDTEIANNYSNHDSNDDSNDDSDNDSNNYLNHNSNDNSDNYSDNNSDNDSNNNSNYLDNESDSDYSDNN